MKKLKNIINDINDYYTNKIITHGETPKGVDWKDESSQLLRFNELLRVISGNDGFTINDLGCGYGRLYEHLISKGYTSVTYRGYDLSPEMIKKASQRHQHRDGISFITIEKPEDMLVSDYTVASGIFNVKMGHREKHWINYILVTLDAMNQKSTRGFAFNLLTKYSDREYMRKDLYYADPGLLFDHCKRKYSKYVSLLHDYPLYEFTILVRKDI